MCASLDRPEPVRTWQDLTRQVYALVINFPSRPFYDLKNFGVQLFPSRARAELLALWLAWPASGQSWPVSASSVNLIGTSRSRVPSLYPKSCGNHAAAMPVGASMAPTALVVATAGLEPDCGIRDYNHGICSRPGRSLSPSLVRAHRIHPLALAGSLLKGPGPGLK